MENEAKALAEGASVLASRIGRLLATAHGNARPTGIGNANGFHPIINALIDRSSSGLQRQA